MTPNLIEYLCRHGAAFPVQGAKAIVYDPAERAVLSRSSESYEILPTEVVGRAEQWPRTWTEAAFKAAARALDSCDRAAVRAIGVSGQQHSLVSCSRQCVYAVRVQRPAAAASRVICRCLAQVMLDRDGKVVRPAKLWCDTESAAEAGELSAGLQFQIPPGFTGETRCAGLEDAQ